MKLGFTEYFVIFILLAITLMVIILTIKENKKYLIELALKSIPFSVSVFISYVLLYNIIWINTTGFFLLISYLLLGIGILIVSIPFIFKIIMNMTNEIFKSDLKKNR